MTKPKPYKYIEGGVCAANGFFANGVHCGIRRNHSKKDLALIYSSTLAEVAAVYTKNLVKGAPLIVTKRHISDGFAQAIICNSGNANTCNVNGEEIAEAMSRLTARELKLRSPDDVIVASTGVIGQPLSLTPIETHIEELAAGLGKFSSAAAQAIMTTDIKLKEVSVEFKLDGKIVHLGGIAKGSGMIHPNMATMLVFITTDAAISHEMLSAALSEDVKSSFNMVSIDGDTSTNDMAVIMANGLAGNNKITEMNQSYEIFRRALSAVTQSLCRMIAADGEGATKLIECHVFGAADKETAKIVSRAVVCSSLVKTAMFGADANWGRVLCAIGYCGCDLNVRKIDVYFSSSKGKVLVCKYGAGVDFSEKKAKEILLESEVEICIDLHSGSSTAQAWGCDLTYDYVKINGDYRT